MVVKIWEIHGSHKLCITVRSMYPVFVVLKGTDGVTRVSPLNESGV